MICACELSHFVEWLVCCVVVVVWSLPCDGLVSSRLGKREEISGRGWCCPWWSVGV